MDAQQEREAAENERKRLCIQRLQNIVRVVTRGKFLLVNQGKRLCKILKRLQRRSEGGHLLADEIWMALAEGIADNLPSEFFEKFGTLYFWSEDEVLTEEEIAFKDLLDKAKFKKAAKDAEAAEKAEQDKDEGGQSGESGSGEAAAADGAGANQEAPMEEDEDEKYFSLLMYLIQVLHVASETTQENKWTWKDEDQRLLREMRHFHNGLESAIPLFETLHGMGDMDNLIDSIRTLTEDLRLGAEDE